MSLLQMLLTEEGTKWKFHKDFLEYIQVSPVKDKLHRVCPSKPLSERSWRPHTDSDKRKHYITSVNSSLGKFHWNVYNMFLLR